MVAVTPTLPRLLNLNLKEMTACEIKYAKDRASIKHGDIILFRGSSLLAKLIMYFDSAYYTHVGVVFEIAGRKMIIDSNGKGVHPDFLSDRIRSYKDFCIVRPTSSVNVYDAMTQAFNRGDIGTKYDFALLLRIAAIRKTGINITSLGSAGRDICSEFARFYSSFIADTYRSLELITPQDFIRHSKDDNNFSVLFNDHIG
jgi:hypothetical protein